MDDYGVYSCADSNFFPGVVASLKSLRLHGYIGKFAVMDYGFLPWQVAYLNGHGAEVISLDWTKRLRYTDVVSNLNPITQGCAAIVFGIYHARMFRKFTMIDADYITLCNLQAELETRINEGEFLCICDHAAVWEPKYKDICGVEPGLNANFANSGFISCSLDYYDTLIEEWRNMLTRMNASVALSGFQGVLNAILSKYNIKKSYVGPNVEWNQSGIAVLGSNGTITISSYDPPILQHMAGVYPGMIDGAFSWQNIPLEAGRVYGAHCCGPYKYWYFLGIKNPGWTDEGFLNGMYQDCQRDAKFVPRAFIDIFKYLLFYDDDLEIRGNLLVPK